VAEAGATPEQMGIIAELQVAQHFDVDAEIKRRADFIVQQARTSHSSNLVLGISGGVDSLAAGFLAMAAVRQAAQQELKFELLAVRLPYGIQKDESDAQECLIQIHPGKTFTVDIKPACDAALETLKASGTRFKSLEDEDFVLGNIKARQRMVLQYAIANNSNGLVIGTDHASEALMGFFTKYGDGGADITPLAGLNKRRVRAIARAFGAPDKLVSKIPTADLESLAPLKPDELVFGVTYTEIDDFLEGKPVTEHSYNLILCQYKKTIHKRRLPSSPNK
jgi:NAD+ synthase